MHLFPLSQGMGVLRLLGGELGSLFWEDKQLGLCSDSASPRSCDYWLTLASQGDFDSDLDECLKREI